MSEDFWHMYLGIDIGTSAVKAVLVGDDGQIVSRAMSVLDTQSPHRFWSEQDPQSWWNATLLACKQLSNQAHPAFSQVVAIGLSGQMHGAVCLDENLNVIRPAILWNDGRSGSVCREMDKALPDLGNLAGVTVMPGFTAPKLRWLKQNEPESYRSIRHVLLPKDFIRLKLAGILATDVSDAAGTLWFDQKNRCWSQPLCEISDTELDWLPEVFEGTQATGQLTDWAATELGLSKTVIVAAGGGDAPAGAVGSHWSNQQR